MEFLSVQYVLGGVFKFLIKSLYGILFKLKGLNYLSFTNAES